MHHALAAVESHVGRDIDDASLLLFLHGGNHGATALPDSFDIYRHHPVPFFFVDILKPRVSDRHAHKNSRVVDQPVNFLESIEGFFCHRLATGEICHVNVCCERLAAAVCNGFGDSFGGGTVDVSDHRSSAFTRDAEAIRATDTMPTARDHDNFTIQ